SDLASDISTRILNQARRAIYPMERAEKIPQAYLKAFCLKGAGAQAGSFTLQPALRERVRFQEINLNTTLPDNGLFDLVVLRNVMIYFDADTKRAVCRRLLDVLRPGGHLFIGHSESLNGLDLPVQTLQPAVYRKPQ
ncbi:MAG: methyltransferase domain-containing protein, partial [Thiomonas sp.]|nr:methyltransferase domain-containing protein [Thiomonas sp.]